MPTDQCLHPSALRLSASGRAGACLPAGHHVSVRAMKGTDALLAARLAAGDELALAEAFDQFGSTVYNAALRVLRNETAAQDVVREGVRRLVPYQSVAYARLYLDRLAPIVEADADAGMEGRVLREVARHLAVRMSYEDVVRVAQAKISPARLQRIAREELRVKDEPYSVHDFLKPGFEELTQLLPPALARPSVPVPAMATATPTVIQLTQPSIGST